MIAKDFEHEHNPFEEELTVQEVAAELEVHDQTVRNYIRRGVFPHARRLGLSPRGPVVIPRCCLYTYNRVMLTNYVLPTEVAEQTPCCEAGI